MSEAGRPEAGRREAKKTETMAALRDAAFARFLQHGFSESRVADIAEDCGVSERTFFRYFGSKEHAALDGLASWLDHLIEAIEELPDSYAPIEALNAVMAQAAAGRFAFGADQVRSAIAYTSYPEVRAEFTLMTDGLRLRLVDDFARRAGTDPLDPYPRVLGSVLAAGLFAVMESWLHGGRGENPWTLARDTLTRVAGDLAG